jgi:hypothetical protein
MAKMFPNTGAFSLKTAEKKNVKLTKIDREERDPKLEKYEKLKKKGCK